jgi:Spy/CpxP family protein refolding chaperone
MALAQPALGTAVSQDAAHTLSDSQKQAMKRIETESKKKAAPIALKLAATAKKIYENMLSDKPNDALRKKLAAELDAVAGQLLTIKGQTIHDLVMVLTPEQKRLIKNEMQKPGAAGDLSEVIAKTFKLVD